MVELQPGDIEIRGITARGFLLLDARLTPIAGPFEFFATALAAARARRPHRIWQQSIDHRGRLLGDPFPLTTREGTPARPELSQPTTFATATAERIAVLNRLHAKWTRDLEAVVGVNPEVALATAEALDGLEHYIQQLQDQTNKPFP